MRKRRAGWWASCGRNLLRDGDRLWRTARDGRAHTPGFAEDYANLADGLLAAHAALGAPEDLQLAVRLVDRLVADFWDEASGTLFDTAEEHDRAVARPALDRGQRARHRPTRSRPTCCCGWRCSPARRTTTAAPAASCAPWRRPSTASRRRSAACSAPWIAASPHRSTPWSPVTRRTRPPSRCATPWPGRTLRTWSSPRARPTAALDGWPLFEGKVPRDGLATAYVCRGYACEAPTTDPSEAAAQVARMTLSPAGS